MRVGLNLLYLIPGVVGGTETYAVSLLHALARVGAEHEYFVFLPSEAAELPLPPTSNFIRVVCPLRASRRPLRYAWEQAILPFQVRSRSVHVLHSLGYVGPVAAPCPHVVTVHDVNFLALQGSMALVRSRVLRLLVGKVVGAAARVIAVSEFSRDEIARYLPVPRERLIVIHEAVETDVTHPAEASWRAAAARHGIRQPYVAAFSSLSPHKNVIGLIEAFALACADLPHRLVLLGHLPTDSSVADAIARTGLGERAIATGYLPRPEVSALLRGAELFVCPSLYEGFGLPVLEAQAAGVAVACSVAGSLPEVAGKGAIYFDPRSAAAMGATLRRALLEPELRATLVSLGLENLTRFSWDRTARLTLDVYRACAPTAG